MYGVVWQHNAPESGSLKKLMSVPEALDTKTPEEAKKEGLQILSELPPEQKSAMRPLAVVEVTEQMMSTLNDCEKVFLPNADDDGELEFVDISHTSFWQNQGWWFK